MTNRSLLHVAFLLFLSGQLDSVAKPGESGTEKILNSKTTSVSLYLVELHRDRKGRIDALVAWIPDDIKSRCLGKPLSHCRKLDHCLRYAKRQRCNENMTNCRPYVVPMCKKLGITESKRRPAGAAPTRVLTHMVPYKKTRAIFEQVKGIPKKFKGKYQIPILSKAHEFRGRVRWEEWTNGENFKFEGVSK